MKFPAGLTEEVVREISAIKNEPEWMLDIRLQAYKAFLELPLPSEGPDLSFLDFDSLCYFARSAAARPTDRWDRLPEDIRKTYDAIGLPEAEQKYLAGVGAQYDSEVVYQNIRKEWERAGVIFVDTDTALQKYPEMIREYFGSVVPYLDNKFAALNTAVWSGGSFIYIPRGVKVEIPLQAYYRINIANLGQFERTLIIVEDGAELQYVEGCTAPIYNTDSLHAAVVEIVVKRQARMRYTAIQNWSTNVVNIVTGRMKLGEGATGEWIDGNIGSKVTRKCPRILLEGEGARAEVLSLSMAREGQNQDTGARAIHLAPNTSSSIVAKSISSGNGICSYRGEVAMEGDAMAAKSVVKCDALLLDEAAVSNTYPLNVLRRGDVEISHEASVSRIDEEQIFYLMSRGIEREDALSIVMNGFIEPIVKQLPMEYAVELNRLIDMSMEGSVG